MRAVSPLSLAGRLLVATVVVLGLVYFGQRALVTALLPVFAQVSSAMDSDVKVLRVTLGHDGPNDTVKFDVNLAHPVDVGGRTVYPYGTHSIPDGFMTVNLGVASLLQYAALLLILVLAWPCASAGEWIARMLVTTPLVGLMLVIPAPSTALSLVWGPFHEALAPQELWPLLAWSRFLSGGGGLALAFSSAVVAVMLGRRYGERRNGAAKGSPMNKPWPGINTLFQ